MENLKIIIIKNVTIFEILKNFAISYPPYRFEIIGIVNEEELNQLIKINDRPDLILLSSPSHDRNMNEFKLCKKIKQNNFFKKTKIIFLLSKSKLKTIKKVIMSGADGYITDFTDASSLMSQIIGIIAK